MERSELAKFYLNVVEPIAGKIIAGKNGFVFVKDSDAFYEEYLEHKALIKRVSGPKDKLDPHKTSACMLSALFKLRQIQDRLLNETSGETGNEEFLEERTRANAQLAVNVGLFNLIAHMEPEEVVLEEGFIFPELTFEKKNPENKSYLDSLVRALYYTGVVNQGNVNLLLVSNIFFLLEEYHKQGYKLKKLQNSE